MLAFSDNPLAHVKKKEIAHLRKKRKPTEYFREIKFSSEETKEKQVLNVYLHLDLKDLSVRNNRVQLLFFY